MTTDINSVILSLNLDMQQAATAHFRSLPANEARTLLHEPETLAVIDQDADRGSTPAPKHKQV
jgi:hypothetical protein